MTRLALSLAALLLLCAPAAAQPRFGAPAHGYYAELGLGATQFIGDAQRYAALGPTFAVRAGKDLTSWFAVGGRLAASVHEATVPPPPDREYFQLYTAAADARLRVRVGHLAMFVEGGVGFADINTNILDRVGVTDPETHFTLVANAGAGMAWHTQNRHFSFGLAGNWELFADFAGSQAVDVRCYLRYTK